MTDHGELDTESQAAELAPAALTERRIPFTLRVATAWTAQEEFADEDDGQMLYLKRSLMTGVLASTAAGRDVSFSDLEVVQP